MTFAEIIKRVLLSVREPRTPQEIRELIKRDYPSLYGTQSHIRNVEKGHYKNLDHALLAQIYGVVRTHKYFSCDTTSKPMNVSLRTTEGAGIATPIKSEGRKRNYSTTGSSVDHMAQRVEDILENAERYHEAYYKAEVFGGPSLYFHQRALETRRQPGSLEHIEYVYATLVSWGMHRMGKGGPKMCNFDIFRQSIEELRGPIAEAQEYDLHAMNNERWFVQSWYNKFGHRLKWFCCSIMTTERSRQG